MGLKYTYINQPTALVKVNDSIEANDLFRYLQIEEFNDYIGKTIKLISNEIQHKSLNSVCLFSPGYRNLHVKR
jgi:hypothetical protein